MKPHLLDYRISVNLIRQRQAAGIIAERAVSKIPLSPTHPHWVREQPPAGPSNIQKVPYVDLRPESFHASCKDETTNDTHYLPTARRYDGSPWFVGW